MITFSVNAKRGIWGRKIFSVSISCACEPFSETIAEEYPVYKVADVLNIVFLTIAGLCLLDKLVTVIGAEIFSFPLEDLNDGFRLCSGCVRFGELFAFFPYWISFRYFLVPVVFKDFALAPTRTKALSVITLVVEIAAFFTIADLLGSIF